MHLLPSWSRCHGIIRLFTILSIGKRHSIYDGIGLVYTYAVSRMYRWSSSGQHRETEPVCKKVFDTACVPPPGIKSRLQKIRIDSQKVCRTHWWVVTLKKRCENCGAESSGPCGAGKLATNITGFRAKLCLLCLRKATLSLAIRSG